jgi:hypothetical protein
MPNNGTYEYIHTSNSVTWEVYTPPCACQAFSHINPCIQRKVRSPWITACCARKRAAIQVIIEQYKTHNSHRGRKVIVRYLLQSVLYLLGTQSAATCQCPEARHVAALPLALAVYPVAQVYAQWEPVARLHVDAKWTWATVGQ